MKKQWVYPRWGIWLIDLVLCLAALAVAYLLRFNFVVPQLELDLLWPVLPVFLLVRLATFIMAGIQRLMVRHTNTEDARRIFLTVLVGSLIFLVFGAVRYFAVDGMYFLPLSVIAIDFMATAMLMITARILFKLLHLRSKGAGKDEVRVVIHGAGEAGLITKRTLERAGTAKYNVMAFVDDDPKKVGKRLEGASVHHTERLAELLEDKAIDQLIIAIGEPQAENRRRVVDTAIAAKVRVLTIPPVNDWINGQLSTGQILEVRIEDLLGRQPIQLGDSLVKTHFLGRNVLITGAAGSIGSELVRQLGQLGVGRLILVDVAESGLYDMDMELRTIRNSVHPITRVGDVRDKRSMEQIFATYKPEVVFHAAAYKHVPMMEAQPSEAVRTNVQGTRNIAELSVAHGVDQFILISTDKAVNPTSVMGATKRVAEMLVNSLSADPACRTRFTTTRFGNVLGSSGSVIPLFRKQIAAGGPVTLTHPEVTRFFMTIPEACRLVLEAATMGKGGEIFVFDMGQPMRIADLADKMIRLSGKEPGKEIDIVHTGLRPGEKLYEELLATAENTLPTHHPGILIGKVRNDDRDRVLDLVGQLVAETSEPQLPILLRELVPEYKDLGPKP
ncbi:MAG: polysaccharide biosynthesis protein [Flavobacteriales bacterium]|nr:polysaccharide biosynthesis protein [Flavobacteriales bacterium]